MTPKIIIIILIWKTNQWSHRNKFILIKILKGIFSNKIDQIFYLNTRHANFNKIVKGKAIFSIKSEEFAIQKIFSTAFVIFRLIFNQILTSLLFFRRLLSGGNFFGEENTFETFS